MKKVGKYFGIFVVFVLLQLLAMAMKIEPGGILLVILFFVAKFIVDAIFNKYFTDADNNGE